MGCGVELLIGDEDSAAETARGKEASMALRQRLLDKRQQTQVRKLFPHRIKHNCGRRELTGDEILGSELGSETRQWSGSSQLAPVQMGRGG
jgi:hypothetical protein